MSEYSESFQDNNQLFSVIILSYNNEQFICDALASVLDQDYPEIELIVADDCSESFHKTEIESYIASHANSNLSSYFVYQNITNFGTVKNANVALKMAHGKYIKLLGADDMLYDSSVLRNAQQVLHNAYEPIAISYVMKCTPDMQEIGLMDTWTLSKLPRMSAQEIYQAMCIRNILPAVGVFFKKEFFDTFGFFDEDFRLLEDWPTWLRYTRQNHTFEVSTFISARYRYSIGAASNYNKAYIHDKELAFQKEIAPYRMQIGHFRYLHALISLKVRNAKLVRRLYFCMFNLLNGKKSV